MSFSQLDLFAIPFEYNLSGNTKTKKTIIGGILSLVIIVISFSYLGYLAQMYFNGEIQPTVGVMSILYQEEYSIIFPSNLIAFRFLVNNSTIQDYEQEKGKKYLSYLISQWVKVSDTDGQIIQYSAVPCEEEYLQGHYCVDYSKGGTQPNYLNITYTNTDLSNGGFQVGFSYCNLYFESPDTVCASTQEIQDMINQNFVGVQFKFVTHEFNASAKKLEQRVQTELFLVSPDIVLVSMVKFVKEQVQIIDGVIIQSQNNQEFIQSFVRQDIIQSQANIVNSGNGGVYLGVDFLMNQMGNQMKVQYPQITIILAQFSSVFNTLLILGLASKKVAKSQIIQDFVELHLKVYYKKTALQLLKATESKQNTTSNATAKAASIFSSLDFKDIYQRIKSMDYKKALKDFMDSDNVLNSNVGLMKNIPCTIFKERQISKEKKVYQKLIEETQKSMNIFELQKEILKLKMMIRMILSVEQYAALQVCGAELQVDNQEEYKFEKKSNEKEELFKRLEITELQIREVSKVLPKTTINEGQTWQQINEQKEKLQEEQSRTTALIKNENNQRQVIDEEALFKSIDVDESQRSNFKQTSIRNFPTKQQCEITEIDIELEQKSLTQQPSQKENTKNMVQMKYLDQSKSKTSYQQQQQPERSKQNKTNSSDQQLNNHLEKMDLIEKDENYFEECLQNFLNSYSLPKSDIDNRIMDCMVGFTERNKFKEQFSVYYDQTTPITLR